jgi:hypothetical protein
LLLALPALSVGLFSDDYALIGYLEHRFAYNPPWWDLYRFAPNDAGSLRAMRDSGYLPWWSAPRLGLHLVRPLPSALLALDHALFGHGALGWHVHSLLWYAVLLVSVVALFRRVLAPATASLASLVFAVSGVNVFPYAWPSARYGLLVAAFSAIGIAAHVRARRDAWTPGRWLAPAALLAAMLCGEGALGGVAFAVAYDLFGPAGEGARRIAERVRRALPLALMALAYLVTYALIGGGARDSGGYLSPLSDPAGFLSVAATRFPVLLANALLGIPAEASTLGFATALAVAGVVATALFALLWRACAPLAEDDERAAVGWLTVGVLASIATGVGGFPGARELIVANLGIAPIVAIVLRHGFEAGPLALVRRASASGLVLTQLVFGPLVQLANIAGMSTAARGTEAVAGAIVREIHGSSRAFLLVSSDPMVAMYAPAMLAVEGYGRPDCWGWISGSPHDVTIARTASSSFSLRLAHGAFLRTSFEQLFRDPRLPFSVGDTFPICGASVRIASVEAGLPARLEVTADGDLDAPTTPWLAWDAGQLKSVVFPPVGQESTIHWAVGPSGAF